MFLSLVLSFSRLQAALSESHSLLYYYSLKHGSADLPEYSILGRLDGCEIDYYDKNMEITVPRQQWMAEAFEKSYWDEYTITQAGFHGLIKGQVDRWLRQNNQTSSTHYVQGLFGCELNDANPSVGVLKLAYDGRYAFSFDKDKLVWTVHDPVAQTRKVKWDKETKMNLYFKSLLEKDCADLWRTYYSIGKALLTRQEGKVEKDKHVGLIVVCVLVSLANVIVLIYIWRRKWRDYNVVSTEPESFHREICIGSKKTQE